MSGATGDGAQITVTGKLNSRTWSLCRWCKIKNNNKWGREYSTSGEDRL